MFFNVLKCFIKNHATKNEQKQTRLDSPTTRCILNDFETIPILNVEYILFCLNSLLIILIY